jgi:hypothetical protein
LDHDRALENKIVGEQPNFSREQSIGRSLRELSEIPNRGLPLTAVSEIPHRSLAVAAVVALRPRQWLKNVLVFAAPLAAGSLLEPDVLIP